MTDQIMTHASASARVAGAFPASFASRRIAMMMARRDGITSRLGQAQASSQPRRGTCLRALRTDDSRGVLLALLRPPFASRRIMMIAMLPRRVRDGVSSRL